jgi:hypothetical protein
MAPVAKATGAFSFVPPSIGHGPIIPHFFLSLQCRFLGRIHVPQFPQPLKMQLLQLVLFDPFHHGKMQFAAMNESKAVESTSTVSWIFLAII